MKYPFAWAGVLARLAVVLLLTAAGHQACAQTTGSITPGADQAAPAAKDEPPPGGCMPIGVTASGEVVFPFLCKGFIEQHKGANQKPVAADDKQKQAAADAQPKKAEENAGVKSADERSTAKQPDNVAPRRAEPGSDAAAQGSNPEPAAADEPRPKGDQKPESAEDKIVARPADSTASIARSAPEPAEPAALPERGRRKSREGSAGPPGCTRFHSYDASSGTYTDYSGRRRACRS
jgi:hypothetical protein